MTTTTGNGQSIIGKKGLKALRVLLSFAIAYCLLPIAGFAKSAGKSSANFLKMPVGGRAAAMGEAQTAAVDDVMALHWNPAGLGLLRQNEVGFMRNSYVQEITQDVLYYAHPTQSRGTFAGGVSSLRVGGIAGFDGSGVPTGDLSASDTLMTFGWAKGWDGLSWAPGLKTGGNFKLLQKKLGGDSANAFLLDMGVLHEFRGGWFERLRAGFTLQNLGGGLQFVGDAAKPPTLMKLGAAYPLFGENLILALDLVSPSDNDLFFNLGLDYRLWDILAFRAGYKGQNDADTGVTYGLRLGNERLHLDYAFAPLGALGDSHRVSVGFRFGRTYRQTQVQDQIRQAYERAEARYAQGYLVEAYMQASLIMDVAPWHRPSKTLMRHIEQEFKQLEDISRREQLQAQIDDHFTRGEQNFQLDDLIAARREFEAILALQPDHAGAKTYLNRIDERFKSIVTGFYETAMRYFAAGDYKQAKDFLEKVLVVEPEHAEAREQLSRTDELLRHQERAAEQKAVMEAVRPLYHAGLTAFEQKKYEEALKKFEEILALDTQNAEAKRYRALCRDLASKEVYEEANIAAREGDWPRANDLFKKALKYKPEFIEAQKGLDKVRAHLGEQRKGESQQMYRQALEAFLAGDQDKALDFAQKALEMDSENLEAKRMVERIMQKRGGQPQ